MKYIHYNTTVNTTSLLAIAKTYESQARKHNNRKMSTTQSISKISNQSKNSISIYAKTASGGFCCFCILLLYCIHGIAWYQCLATSVPGSLGYFLTTLSTHYPVCNQFDCVCYSAACYQLAFLLPV